VGKAVLSFLSQEQVGHILGNATLERFTQRTVDSPNALLKELEKTRCRGYALDDEEFEEGLRCVAVPLFNSDHAPIGAVSIAGPTFRITARRLPFLINHLAHCVDGISRTMGFKKAQECLGN
jgi:IclR family acetate operon transcriptional repressor